MGKKPVPVTDKKQRASSAPNRCPFLPCAFHLNLFGLKEAESLWLLYCADAHCENALCIEKWTSAQFGFFFPFANDQLGYQRVFLSWDAAGGIVISTVC